MAQLRPSAAKQTHLGEGGRGGEIFLTLSTKSQKVPAVQLLQRSAIWAPKDYTTKYSKKKKKKDHDQVTLENAPAGDLQFTLVEQRLRTVQ